MRGIIVAQSEQVKHITFQKETSFQFIADRIEWYTMQLFNTLSQSKEVFTPYKKDTVTMYVCGITPYDTTHLGHAFTYISFDVLVRYLTYKGYNVTYTQNVTDINDRDNDILKRAQEQKITWQELADYWTKHFLRDMKTLNWVMPTNYLKASEQIKPMITLIQALLDHHGAYAVGGNVYLDITRFQQFGKLSKLSHAEMLQIAKDFEEDIDNPEKKHPLDITLWRATVKDQPAHIPSFASPFGPGRPGWHIECSAMAIDSLGEQIDIHGGGRDLIYPHHESEIVQSEGATQKSPFAKYWLHAGTVSYKGEKMSKSLGNLVMVSDLLKTYSPDSIRWMLINHHYRSSWEYFEDELKKTQGIMEHVQKRLQGTASQNTVQTVFDTYMDNDLQLAPILDAIAQDQIPPQQSKYILTTLGFTLA